MAAKFNIVAQLLLQGPKNLTSVVKDIKSQLSNVQANVSVKIDPRATRQIASLNKQIKDLQAQASGVGRAGKEVSSNLDKIEGSANKAGKAVRTLSSESSKTGQSLKGVSKDVAVASGAIAEFGRQSGLAVKRFLAFSIPTSILLGFTVAIKKGFQGAIEFERELIKIAQVTGKTTQGLSELRNEITRLAVTFGVSSQELLETSRVLAQAGLSARDTKVALEALAKASLAPTFRDMKNTVEGTIAALNQFGFGVDELEGKLGAINAVAGSFAVEAEDIVFAIRRTGGAFKAAGGDLEELIGLFTAVRSTTRESAETIATGFRTIFTRLQRPQTIAFLEELGIKLRDAKGQFIGPLESIKKLNQALSEVPPTDARFAAIVEEIGGYRQVSKVIPLIREMNTALAAHQTALGGTDSLTQDAAIAQNAYAVQLVKTKEEFNELIRSLGDDSNIRGFAEGALKLASAFIKIVDAAKPMLPILAAVAGFKAVSGAIQFGKGFLGGGGGGGNNPLVQEQNQLLQQEVQVERELIGALKTTQQQESSSISQRGGLVTALNTLRAAINKLGFGGTPPIKRASGGYVPGSGNGDTVPALLTPGEFVIRKSAAKSLGPKQLNKMNRYAAGGSITVGAPGDPDFAGLFLSPPGPDNEAGQEANHTKGLRAAGIIANKINAKLGLAGKGNLRGTERAPGQDIAIHSAMFGSDKKGAPPQSTGLNRKDLAKRLSKNEAFNNDKGKDFITDLGKENHFSQASLSPGLKREFFSEASLLGAKFDFGKGVPNVQASDIGHNIPITGWPGILAIDPAIEQQMKATIRRNWKQMLNSIVNQQSGSLAPDHNPFVDQNFDKIFKRAGGESVEGHAFEAMLLALGQDPNFSAKSDEDFDFPGTGEFAKNIGHLFNPQGTAANYLQLDAKRTATTKNISSLVKKAANAAAVGQLGDDKLQFTPIPNTTLGKAMAAATGSAGPVTLAKGGMASGTDTVPALLTPGEFVINKKSASRIGADSLTKMNKFATGGFVPGASVQKFAAGGSVIGKVAAGGFAISMITALTQMGGEVNKTTQKITELVTMFSTLLVTTNLLNDFSAKGLATKAAERDVALLNSTAVSTNTVAEGGNTTSKHVNTEATMANAVANRMATKGLKTMSFVAQGVQVALLAASTALYFFASQAKEAGELQLKKAKTESDAKDASQAVAGAKQDQAGAIGAGIGAISGAKLGAQIGFAIAGPMGALIGGIITSIGGAIIGFFTGKALSDFEGNMKKSISEFRQRILGESLDRFGDVMADITAKRATLEGKSFTLRKELEGNMETLAVSEFDERAALTKQLKGQVATYFTLGQQISGSVNDIEKFRRAQGGLGGALIKSIASIRGLPISEVETMFEDMIDQRKKAEKATEALIVAEEAAAVGMKKFQDLADGLDLASASAAKFAGDLDTIVALMKGDFTTTQDFVGPAGFDQIGKDFSSIVNPREFSEALKVITSPFGKLGENLRQQATLQVNAARSLPDILQAARSEANNSPGGEEDFKTLLRDRLGAFPELLKDVILKGVDEQFNQEKGRAKLFKDIRKDPASVAVELMGETLDSMQKVLPQIRDAILKEGARIASAQAQKTKIEIQMMDKRLSLLKARQANDNEITKLSGGKVDFKSQDLETQQVLLGKKNQDLVNNAEGVAKRLLQVNRDIASMRAAFSRGLIPFDPAKINQGASILGELSKEASSLTKVLAFLGDASRGVVEDLRRQEKESSDRQTKVVQGVIGYLEANDKQRAGLDTDAGNFRSFFQRAGGIKIEQTSLDDLKNVFSDTQLQSALKAARAAPDEVQVNGKKVTREALVQRILAQLLVQSKKGEDFTIEQVSQLVGREKINKGPLADLQRALTKVQKTGFIALEKVQGALFSDLVKKMDSANDRFLIRFEQILLRQNARELSAEVNVLEGERTGIRDQQNSSKEFRTAVNKNSASTQELKVFINKDRDNTALFAKAIFAATNDLNSGVEAKEKRDEVRSLISDRRVPVNIDKGLNSREQLSADIARKKIIKDQEDKADSRPDFGDRPSVESDSTDDALEAFGIALPRSASPRRPSSDIAAFLKNKSENPFVLPDTSSFSDDLQEFYDNSFLRDTVDQFNSADEEGKARRLAERNRNGGVGDQERFNLVSRVRAQQEASRREGELTGFGSSSGGRPSGGTPELQSKIVDAINSIPNLQDKLSDIAGSLTGGDDRGALIGADNLATLAAGKLKVNIPGLSDLKGDPFTNLVEKIKQNILRTAVASSASAERIKELPRGKGEDNDSVARRSVALDFIKGAAAEGGDALEFLKRVAIAERLPIDKGPNRIEGQPRNIVPGGLQQFFGSPGDLERFNSLIEAPTSEFVNTLSDLLFDFDKNARPPINDQERLKDSTKDRLVPKNFDPRNPDVQRILKTNLSLVLAELKVMDELGSGAALTMESLSSVIPLLAENLKQADEEFRKSLSTIANIDDVSAFASEMGITGEALARMLIDLNKNSPEGQILAFAAATRNIDIEKFASLNTELKNVNNALEGLIGSEGKLTKLRRELDDLGKKVITSDGAILKEGASAVAKNQGLKIPTTGISGIDTIINTVNKTVANIVDFAAEQAARNAEAQTQRKVEEVDRTSAEREKEDARRLKKERAAEEANESDISPTPEMLKRDLSTPGRQGGRGNDIQMFGSTIIKTPNLAVDLSDGGSLGTASTTSSEARDKRAVASMVGLDSGSQASLNSFSSSLSSFVGVIPALTSLGSTFASFHDSVDTLNKAFNSFSGSLTHNINIKGSVNVDITGSSGLITSEMEEGLKKFGQGVAKAEVRKLTQKMADSGMFGEGGNYLLNSLDTDNIV